MNHPQFHGVCVWLLYLQSIKVVAVSPSFPSSHLGVGFFSFQEEQFSSVNAEVSQLHLRVHKAAELRPPRLSLRLISRGKRSSEPESNVRSMRAGWRVQLSGIRDCVKLNNNTNQTHFKSSKMTRQHGRHLNCSPSSWHTPPHPTKSSQMWS